MGFTGLHDSYGSWHLNICRFLFGLSTFLSLHSCLWRHFVLCCKEKLEPLDHVYRATANFKRSWVCMISVFRCYLHVASLFWLISIAKYVFFKSLNTCFLRDKIWHLLWTCCLLAFYIVTPGPAVFVSQVYHGYHICPPTFFFGDAVALLRESFTLVLKNPYAFLALSDQAYVCLARCVG